MYRVFIVDDEPFILEGMPYLIPWVEYGIEIVGEASDGEQALQILEQLPVDILITDINMPNMDGLTLIRLARERFPAMKFIILSGYDEFKYVKQGLQYGIENYLLKPIQESELHQTILNTVEKLHHERKEASLPSNHLDILRDNILYRWVQGRIALAELKSRAEMLGFLVDFLYYVVAVIRPERSEDEETSMPGMDRDEFVTILYTSFRLETERRLANTQCFCDPEGDLILIQGSTDHSGQIPALHAALGSIREIMKQRYSELQLFMSIGTSELSHANVAASYTSAKRLQEYFLIYGSHHIVDEYFVQQDTQLTRLDMDLQSYSKLLLAKDKQAVDALIDTWFNALQSGPSPSPSQIRNSAVELILHTKQFIQNHKDSGDWVHQDYKALFSPLFQIHTLDQMKEHLKYIAGAAIECITLEEDGFSPVIRQVLNYIHAHYQGEISLKTLGQQFHVHPVYLGRLFQRETNQLFSDYLNIYRIEAAKQLLVDPQFKTNEIAGKVGYVDPSYFYKQFKKYCGVSPSLFREML